MSLSFIGGHLANYLINDLVSGCIIFFSKENKENYSDTPCLGLNCTITCKIKNIYSNIPCVRKNF